MKCSEAKLFCSYFRFGLFHTLHLELSTFADDILDFVIILALLWALGSGAALGPHQPEVLGLHSSEIYI